MDISVVMAVYNGGAALAGSIESVLQYEGRNLELIVVDDGSADSTPTILDSYSRQDSRVRVLSQENRGLTAALIRGCAAARGEFIARQDCGDLSLPQRFDSQLSCLRAQEDAAICVTGIRLFTDQCENVQELVPDASVEEMTRRVRENLSGIPAHGCVMFRRAAYEAVGGYRMKFIYAQDCDLWLRLSRVGGVVSTGSVGYLLNAEASGISASKGGFQREFTRLAAMEHRAVIDGRPLAFIESQIDDLWNRVKGSRFSPPSRNARAAAHYRLACMLQRVKSPSANREFRRAIQADALYWRAWFRMIIR